MKLIKKMLSQASDTTRKSSFMPVPVFGYTQEAGFQFGAGALYSFYADKSDTLNRSSNFSFTSSYSTKKTYNFSVYGDAWSKGNLYHGLAELRLRKMPFNFYGIGPRTAQSDEHKLELRQIKLQFDLEKQLLKNLFSGVSIGFEDYKVVDRIGTGVFYRDPNISGRSGGKIVFAGISQSYDNRNSNNYPTKGFFGRISYQYGPEIFGQDNFSGSQIKLNLRQFFFINKHLVLGSQGIYHTVQSDHVPFYLLPQLGNDEIMRGYYTGRYRDKNLFAFQSELRYRYSSRFGAVLFAGTGTVWGRRDFTFNNFKPNLGAGLRYFYDPGKGLSVRIDYGLGEKKANEDRQSGFYVSLAEAF
ncbi:BamA/TamA family outer membrane protein [Pedobacter rhodius]|uniref:BamA/TamA family outer membrane protein n=1 Tax=Pedobacter rhodius TaxID=3004098 RepID=A0ABT4KWZ0_9SPHI|nr:BamA/TamA family outer membrane protein [Pedobacter sp. SJ11]MCZ4222388.1 BamA/TamA family outer membrane protein [Pedobacter sp. SJ11]